MRLIDADALIDEMALMVPWAIDSPAEIARVDGLSDAYEAVKNAPTIDAVPVVRCRECVYNREGYCTQFQINLSGISSAWYRVDDDGFCSRGQRREDGDA